MTNFQRPGSQETELVGQWLSSAGRVMADVVCDRIDYLIQDVFNRLAVDASGWLTLYRDPVDGRYWELSYPSSDESGGGAPRLRMLTYEEARGKFGIP
jgi:hypothetical protein